MALTGIINKSMKGIPAGIVSGIASVGLSSSLYFAAISGSFYFLEGNASAQDVLRERTREEASRRIKELNDIMENSGANLGDALNNDSLLTEKLIGILNTDILGEEPPLKDEFYNSLLAIVRKYPLFQQQTVIDIAKYPHLGYIKALMLGNLVYFPSDLPAGGHDTTDPATIPLERRVEIAEALKLTGHHLDFWKKYSILVIDNNSLDEKQFSMLYALLDAVPQPLHRASAIIIGDELAQAGDKVSWRISRGQNANPLPIRFRAINLFNIEVGEFYRNMHYGPSSVPPMQLDSSDMFTWIYVHELHHLVSFDSFYGPFGEKALHDRAGNDLRNYLNTESSHPLILGELVASTAEYYFGNTRVALEIALEKFNNGFIEPFNHFLFFADLYSTENTAKFFDVTGGVRVQDGKIIPVEVNLERYDVPLTRDLNGKINSLFVSGKYYLFKRDDGGFIVDVRVSENPFMKSDVNKDFVVGLEDLVRVALHFGTNRLDENFDEAADLDNNGEVDITDLVTVARDYGIRMAPSLDLSFYKNKLAVLQSAIETISSSNSDGAEAAANNLRNFMKLYFNQIISQEQAIQMQAILFPNYPNPTNDETWIPYRLGREAYVALNIYDQKGYLVRRIDMGKQQKGEYISRDRAIYWDGKNDNGENAASGVYPYEFFNSDFASGHHNKKTGRIVLSR